MGRDVWKSLWQRWPLYQQDLYLVRLMSRFDVPNTPSKLRIFGCRCPPRTMPYHNCQFQSRATMYHLLSSLTGSPWLYHPTGRIVVGYGPFQSGSISCSRNAKIIMTAITRTPPPPPPGEPVIPKALWS